MVEPKIERRATQHRAVYIYIRLWPNTDNSDVMILVHGEVSRYFLWVGKPGPYGSEVAKRCNYTVYNQGCQTDLFRKKE